MKLYTGRRARDGTCRVWVIEADGDSHLLDPRLDLYRHSPTGFEWGYGGSGPSQLALALLADALGDDEKAILLHHQFKRYYVGGLSRDRDAMWCVGQDVIVAFAAAHPPEVEAGNGKD